jgi:hypothetical protein
MVDSIDQDMKGNEPDAMRVQQWLAEIGAAIRQYSDHDDLIK